MQVHRANATLTTTQQKPSFGADPLKALKFLRANGVSVTAKEVYKGYGRYNAGFKPRGLEPIDSGHRTQLLGGGEIKHMLYPRVSYHDLENGNNEILGNVTDYPTKKGAIEALMRSLPNKAQFRIKYYPLSGGMFGSPAEKKSFIHKQFSMDLTA